MGAREGKMPKLTHKTSIHHVQLASLPQVGWFVAPNLKMADLDSVVCVAHTIFPLDIFATRQRLG